MSYPGQATWRQQGVPITFHPGGGGAGRPRELDSDAYGVLQLGGEAIVDDFLNRRILLRAGGSRYRDCADVWAGHAHLGFRPHSPHVPRACRE